MNNTGLPNMPLVEWFSEMGPNYYNYAPDGPIFSPLNDFAQEIVINSKSDQRTEQSSSSESCTSQPYTFPKRSSNFEISHSGLERPSKHTKISQPSNSGSENHAYGFSSNNTFEISFGADKELKPKAEVPSHDEFISFLPLSSKGVSAFYDQQLDAPRSRPPPRDQEHVIAERRRREKLNQQFIDLATIVPGLKKMDKASVLGGAVNYLKQLQERVKFLEDQAMKKSEERVIFVNKSKLSNDRDDDTSSWDENPDGNFKESLPQVEARISDKNVLVRIHCENQKGLASTVLSEIERLHLTVANTCFLPFGDCRMDITITARMDAEFSMTVKDLVRNLYEVSVNQVQLT